MDTTGKTYLVVGAIALIAVVIAFHFISKRAPKGTLVVVGVVLWIVGMTLSGVRIRETVFLAGLCKLSGFIGGLLGIFDLLRAKKELPTPRVLSNAESEKDPNR